MSPTPQEPTEDGTCPWCGYQHEDLWDLEIKDGNTEELECDSCEKSILVTLHVSYDYTMQAKEPTNAR